MITPFHFACFCEERLKAQFEAIDPALGSFVRILRRFSLMEDRATLQFGAQTPAGEEFVCHVTLFIELISPKEKQTALNCSLNCPETGAQKNIRLLLNTPEEAETQIFKMLEFLQKAFLTLHYKEVKETVAVTSETETSAMETAQHLMSTAGAATQAPAAEPLTPEAAAVTGGKKYVYEKETAAGEAVQLRTLDGKYVPEGQLPATLRIK